MPCRRRGVTGSRGGCSCTGRGRQLKRRGLGEHGIVESAELRSGLDPELLDQRAAGCAISRERVGLPTGAVERDHQLPDLPFTRGLALRQLLQFRDQCGVAPERELGIDPILGRREPQPAKPIDFQSRPSLV